MQFRQHAFSWVAVVGSPSLSCPQFSCVLVVTNENCKSRHLKKSVVVGQHVAATPQVKIPSRPRHNCVDLQVQKTGTKHHSRPALKVNQIGKRQDRGGKGQAPTVSASCSMIQSTSVHPHWQLCMYTDKHYVHRRDKQHPVPHS